MTELIFIKLTLEKAKNQRGKKRKKSKRFYLNVDWREQQEEHIEQIWKEYKNTQRMQTI